MNTLKSYISEYIEYCEYRKRLDSKTLKAYKIDLKQFEIFCTDLSDCFAKNFFTLLLLPNFAHSEPNPCFSSFSKTFCVAELLLESTAIVLFWQIRFAMIFKIVCVLPVPGGPSITLIWLPIAFCTASYWDLFAPKGKISGDSLIESCLNDEGLR